MTIDEMMARIDAMRQACAETEGLRADLAECNRECMEIAHDRDTLERRCHAMREALLGLGCDPETVDKLGA